MTGARGSCLVEVKSVTLVDKGIAMFPDAPSPRGVKHLEELQKAREEGFRAAVIFVIQRDDGRYFAPNEGCDPAFAAALRQAAYAGVDVYAYICKVSREKVKLDRRIPVCI